MNLQTKRTTCMSCLNSKALTCQVIKSMSALTRRRRCTTRSKTRSTRLASTRLSLHRSVLSVRVAVTSTLATTCPLTCPMIPTLRSIGALASQSSSTFCSRSHSQCWRIKSRSLAFVLRWAWASCSASTRSS